MQSTETDNKDYVDSTESKVKSLKKDNESPAALENANKENGSFGRQEQAPIPSSSRIIIICQ